MLLHQRPYPRSFHCYNYSYQRYEPSIGYFKEFSLSTLVHVKGVEKDNYPFFQTDSYTKTSYHKIKNAAATKGSSNAMLGLT